MTNKIPPNVPSEILPRYEIPQLQEIPVSEILLRIDELREIASINNWSFEEIEKVAELPSDNRPKEKNRLN